MKSLCITELAQHVLDVIEIDEIPMVFGSPGIGKSAVYQYIAKALNLEFIDFRLSMCDQTMVNGFPVMENNRSSYAPPKIFPLVGDEIPEGKSGWLISFEELNSAAPSLQPIAYKILHDRMIGDFHIHPSVRFCANGNLETDGAVVLPLSTALASRMIQFKTHINPKNWIDWANDQGDRFHTILMQYLEYRNESVHRFDPKSKDSAYPCPRTLEKVSKLLKLCDKKERDYSTARTSIEGSIGEATTIDFFAYVKYFDSVESVERIIANPLMKPHDDVGIRYATLINTINTIKPVEHDIVQVITHFEQRDSNGRGYYGIEYPALLLKNLLRKHSKLIMSNDPAFNAKLKEYNQYVV